MVLERIKAVVGSKQFLIFIFAWFIFQASWMAVSNRYNAPHDEAAHIGRIQEFADEKKPNIHLNEINNLQYTDVTYSSSYAYYFGMSFPYRIVDNLTDSSRVLLLSMRAINLLVSIAGFYILYKTLKLLIPKRAVLINLVLLATASSTVYVYMSGGVNYDNLQIPLIFSCYYFAVKFLKLFKIKHLALFILMSSLAVTVKYTSLLVLLPLSLYLAVFIVRRWRLFKKEITGILFKDSSINIINVVATLIFTAIVLLVMYKPISNVLEYGTPQPNCKSVHSFEVCMENGIFARNERVKEQNKDIERTNAYIFFYDIWINQMRQTTFGIYNSSDSRSDTLFVRSLVWLLIFGTPLLAYSARHKIIRDRSLSALTFAALIYVLILFLKNFSTYTILGAPYALQGRYILPVLPILFLVAFMVLDHTFKSKLVKTIGVTIAIVSLLSAGLVSYVQLSDESWYFDNNFTRDINSAGKKILSPIDFLILDKQSDDEN